MILTKLNGFLSYHTPANWIVCYTGKRPRKMRRLTKAETARKWHNTGLELHRRGDVDWRRNRLDWNLHGGLE